MEDSVNEEQHVSEHAKSLGLVQQVVGQSEPKSVYDWGMYKHSSYCTVSECAPNEDTEMVSWLVGIG